jgi:hypothetical protein
MRRLRRTTAIAVLAGALLVTMGPSAQAQEDVYYDLIARYVLETVRAFRTAYVLKVVERLREAGIQPKEGWEKDSHAIPLPAQFVKAAGNEIKSFEVGLIGLTPVYKSNLPKTEAEAEALRKMIANRDQTVMTFSEGNEFKGLIADLAIVQSCADCHNSHPNSPKRDFKRYDVMGAIVVRLSK